MKVLEQGNYLIIASYPFKLAWFCLFIIAATLYAAFTIQTDHFATLIGVTIPTIFLFLCRYKLTIFDFNQHQMLQTNYSITGKRSLVLPLKQINNITVNTGLGFSGHNGCILITTNKGSLEITAMSDASYKAQQKLTTKLKSLLHLPTTG